MSLLCKVRLPSNLPANKRLARWAGLLFVCLLPYSVIVQADSCNDRNAGDKALCVEITGGVPDPNSKEAKWARGEEQRPVSHARYWDFIGKYDKHILSGQCWAVSPTVFVGRLEQVFYFTSVSVGGTWDNPRILIQSEAGLEKAPTKFHAYKHNLGLWTETLPFQAIDREIGEHSILLGFGPERTRQIVRNFARMLSFRLRLRYAPVDQAFDSPNITLNGFVDAFKKADRCNRRNSKR